MLSSAINPRNFVCWLTSVDGDLEFIESGGGGERGGGDVTVDVVKPLEVDGELEFLPVLGSEGDR